MASLGHNVLFGAAEFFWENMKNIHIRIFVISQNCGGQLIELLEDKDPFSQHRQ